MPILTAAVAAMALPVGLATGDSTPRSDDRAVEIALGALEAIESGWGLAAYDEAPRVRAAINLRGASVGVTANAVVDRRARRWRLDAAGDVGPLTLLVGDGSAFLVVPPFRQHARGAAGALAPGAGIGRSLSGEVQAMRARLRNGYTALQYGGEEILGGSRVHRIVDRPGPGATATYWIDAESRLPRRVLLAGPGSRRLQVDLGYARGTRPSRIQVRSGAGEDLAITVDPAYDGRGRLKLLHLAVRAGGTPLQADVNLDWAPRVADGFFRLSHPEGSREVPFPQLAQGVLFQAAGALGALARVLAGGG